MNFTIRTVTPDDAEVLAGIYSYYVKKTAITFEYDTPSADEFRRRIEHTLKKYPYIAAESEGRILGYAYAGSFVGREAYDHSSELSIYIDKSIRGCGVGGALYRELERLLSEMGVTNLYACIGVPNEEDEYLNFNSVEFHSHLGFKTVGTFKNCGYKFERWYSMVWMEKIIAPHKLPMERLKPFSEIK